MQLPDTKDVIEVLNREVDARYYLREYDEVLTGNRSNYSSACMSRNNGGRLISEILDYIFTHYLHWTHTQVRDCLTPEIVSALRLDAFIRRIPCPPEVLPRAGELYYVAWHIYPETRNASRVDLINKVYMDVINGRTTKFPKGYFDGNDGYCRARILFLTMIQEFYSFESLDAMYAFFASDDGRRAIQDHKLAVPLRELYSSPLDFLHDALGESKGDRRLYKKYFPLVRARVDRGYVDADARFGPDDEDDDLHDEDELEGESADGSDDGGTDNEEEFANEYERLLNEEIEAAEQLTQLGYNPIESEEDCGDEF